MPMEFVLLDAKMYLSNLKVLADYQTALHRVIYRLHVVKCWRLSASLVQGSQPLR